MPALDWAYLGSLGGEALEDFTATALCQRYPDARQTRPASGDGGIDVLREMPGGIEVWQIKRFTTPLTTGQRRQVIRSWQRFWDTQVAAGRQVVCYHLATPWTPTEPSYEWFRGTVTVDAEFPVRWDGAAFFDALAADFPATADRFFKGPDVLESFVNAKALLAASPVETGSSRDMLGAIASREVALREIRDLVSDYYYVDIATKTSMSADQPPLDRDGPAVLHRYLYLGNNRWSIESVVPKTADAAAKDPLGLEVEFLVEPETDDARNLDEWRLWGVPFTDLPTRTRQTGGPFGEEVPTEGRLSLFPVAPKPGTPGLMMRVETQGGDATATLLLDVIEISHGTDGGGARIVARTSSGVLELEARIGSSLAEPSLELRIVPCPSARPAAVARELSTLAEVRSDQTIHIGVVDGPGIFVASELAPPPVAEFVAEIAQVLVALQPHTQNKLVMPDFRDVTRTQLDHAHRLADIFGGNAFEATWDRLVLVVGDPEPFRTGSVTFDGSAVFAKVESPEFHLGAEEYLITRELATQYLSATLAEPRALENLEAGGELELRAGPDNRVVVAAVVDDANSA